MQDYKFEPHNMKGKLCGKTYCLKCGLVALNNKISEWCIAKGCHAEDHPQYKSKLLSSSGA